MHNLTLLGVGNILEYDDGIAVFATDFLRANYSFVPEISIINGGVEGINLLNLFLESKHIIILDAIEIDDTPGSIYHIPSSELSGYGLNSGGAHELGVLQCFDILELMGKELPKSSVVGIVPKTIDVTIGLSDTMQKHFEHYINTIINILEKEHITCTKTKEIALSEIINRYKKSGKSGSMQEAI